MSIYELIPMEIKQTPVTEITYKKFLPRQTELTERNKHGVCLANSEFVKIVYVYYLSIFNCACKVAACNLSKNGWKESSKDYSN